MANRISPQVKPLPGAVPDFAHPLCQGLVNWWLFNEQGGMKVNDIAAKRNNGTLTGGPIWNNVALSFDGTDDYIAIGDTTNWITPNTLSVWVKYNSSSRMAFYSKGNGSTYEVNSFDGGANTFGVRILNSIENAANTGYISGLVQGKWEHIVVVKTTSATDCRDILIYLNGVSKTVTFAGAATSSDFTNARIASRPAVGGELYFSGLLENFRIYNRALSAQEVKVLYETPYAGIARLKRRMSSFAGISFDTASNSGYQTASSSYSWSHTCSGGNRYLVVGISMLSLAQTVTSITYNSVAMTLLGTKNSVSGACRVELWGLIAPSTGSNTIAVTLSGAIASAGNASSYSGVHQSSPTESFNSAQATNVGAADATVNITTVADNDWAVDIVATDDTAITVGAGQTQTGNVTGAAGSGAMSYEGPKTPAGAVTMSWTNVAALATWSIGGIALRPVSSSSLAALYRFFFGA